MKLVTEYLMDAARFARMAAAEKDPALRDDLLKQADACHRLAAQRAKELGIELPTPPECA